MFILSTFLPSTSKVLSKCSLIRPQALVAEQYLRQTLKPLIELKCLCSTAAVPSDGNPTPLRGKQGYPCWKMLKEVRIRRTIKQFGFERLNINVMRKNKILPPELREICDMEIKALPTDSSIIRKHDRCMITSRARGLYKKFRLSRIVWRHLADYNKIYGYTRARW